MTTADEKMRDKWKLVDSDCRDGDNGIITYHVVAFDEGWQASAAQYAERVKELERQNEQLQAQLSKFQKSEFHPDWSLLQAAQESLREHMGMVSVLHKALTDAQSWIAEEMKEIGGCDHSVGICMCSAFRLADQIDDALSATTQTAEAYKRRIQAEASPLRALIEKHSAFLEANPYCYFELAYTRRTEWMAWICSKPQEEDPQRVVLARGQGSTPDEAAQDAIASMAAELKEGE